MKETNDKVTDITKKKKKAIKEEIKRDEDAIREQMRRDEEEMDMRLEKFKAVMPQIDTSGIEEDEEDDEEEYVIDLQQGVVTQKVNEGIILTDGDEMIRVVKAGTVECKEMAPDPAAPYGDFIRDLFVRKAIAKLIRDIRKERDELEYQQEKMSSYLAESLNKSIQEIDAKRLTLVKCIRGDKVHYEDIPEWAEVYIKEQMADVLTNLIALGEERWG